MPPTVIRTIEYRPATNELDINFVSGRRYIYHDVPADAADSLREAFVKGLHFNRHIRDRYRCTVPKEDCLA